MSLIETGSLLVLAFVGFGITYFGYESAQGLLRAGGLAAGAAIGGWLGFVFAPRLANEALASEELLGIAAVCIVIGAVIGQVLIPNLGRLAVVCLSFTLAAVAALVFISRGGALETVTQTIPRVLETGNPDLLYNRFEELEFVAGLDPQLALGVVFVIAALAAGIAIAHANFMITILITVLGALILAAVVPLLVGSAELQADTVTGVFSEFWFLVFFVTGVVFEAIRYSDDVDIRDFL